jgi:hypothetical protein
MLAAILWWDHRSRWEVRPLDVRRLREGRAMTADIVQRLRGTVDIRVMREAADEIERLRREFNRVRDERDECVRFIEHWHGYMSGQMAEAADDILGRMN